jgi:hypothetical protein
MAARADKNFLIAIINMLKDLNKNINVIKREMEAVFAKALMELLKMKIQYKNFNAVNVIKEIRLQKEVFMKLTWQ